MLSHWKAKPGSVGAPWGCGHPPSSTVVPILKPLTFQNSSVFTHPDAESQRFLFLFKALADDFAASMNKCHHRNWSRLQPLHLFHTKIPLLFFTAWKRQFQCSPRDRKLWPGFPRQNKFLCLLPPQLYQGPADTFPKNCNGQDILNDLSLLDFLNSWQSAGMRFPALESVSGL